VTRKGTRLDPELELTEDWVDVAAKLRLAPESTFRKFKNYWLSKPGNNATKLDWLRTWQNWCMTEAEKLPGAAKSPAFQPSRTPAPQGRPDVVEGEPRFAKAFGRAP
jgi:hypothetical protein